MLRLAPIIDSPGYEFDRRAEGVLCASRVKGAQKKGPEDIASGPTSFETRVKRETLLFVGKVPAAQGG